MLSLATSTEVRSEGDEVVGRVHEVYLYDCSRGTLEEHTVSYYCIVGTKNYY